MILSSATCRSVPRAVAAARGPTRLTYGGGTLPHGSGVGLASLAMRGEEDNTNLRSWGRCNGGRGRRWGHHRRCQGQRRGWRRWWHGVEGGGGVEGRKIGQLDGAKPNFTAIRVLRWWGYSLYTRYVIGIGWHSAADTKNVIYGIGWRKLANTNNLLYQLAYVSQYQYG
jgi:hypothetical protein